jgi:hypothetical protein
MPNGRVLRAPSRKEFGSWVYAVPAISGRRKRICNTLPLLLLSIWFAVWHGLMGFHALRLDALLLFASTTRLKRIRQQYHNCGGTRKIDAEVIALIHQVLETHYDTTTRKPKRGAYGFQV